MLRIVLLLAALLAVAAAAPQLWYGAPWTHGIHSYALPAPYQIAAPSHVVRTVEPVEQHGYQIVY